MNISRFVAGALLLCALPVLAQPGVKPDAKPSFPKVSPDDAANLGLTKKPMVFHLRDITLREALDELQKQSGVPLELSWSGVASLGAKLSLDLETRSFNEAFRAMLDEADVKAHLRRFSGNGAWNLQVGAGPNEGDVWQSGVSVFQLRAANVIYNFNRTAMPGRGEAAKRSQSETLSVTLAFSFNPQLPIVQTPRLHVSLAEDETGHSLLNGETQPNFYGGGIQEECEISLRVPPKSSHKIAHLEGVATYLLTSKCEHWEVADLLNAQNVSHAFSSNGQQVTASVLSAQKKRDGVEVEFQLATPNAGDVDDDQSLEEKNPLFSLEQLAAWLHLRDAKGVSLASEEESGSSDGNGYTVRLLYSVPTPDDDATNKTPVVSEPLTLVFDAPTEFVQTEVPFSFSDLPLP